MPHLPGIAPNFILLMIGIAVETVIHGCLFLATTSFAVTSIYSASSALNAGSNARFSHAQDSSCDFKSFRSRSLMYSLALLYKPNSPICCCKCLLSSWVTRMLILVSRHASTSSKDNVHLTLLERCVASKGNLWFFRPLITDIPDRFIPYRVCESNSGFDKHSGA